MGDEDEDDEEDGMEDEKKDEQKNNKKHNKKRKDRKKEKDEGKKKLKSETYLNKLTVGKKGNETRRNCSNILSNNNTTVNSTSQCSRKNHTIHIPLEVIFSDATKEGF